jgi:hypothetical protein
MGATKVEVVALELKRVRERKKLPQTSRVSRALMEVAAC